VVEKYSFGQISNALKGGGGLSKVRFNRTRLWRYCIGSIPSKSHLSIVVAVAMGIFGGEAEEMWGMRYFGIGPERISKSHLMIVKRENQKIL
jgi:hypothetical protein